MSIEAVSWVLRHSDSTLGSRLVLVVLADYAHDDGSNAFPSVETIGEKTRMSRRSVQYALRRLEDEGEIADTGVSLHGTTVWRLLMGGGGANIARANLRQKDADIARVQNPTRRGADIAPNPLENHQRVSENNDSTATTSLIAAVEEPATPQSDLDSSSTDFEQWLADHEAITGRQPPRPGTKARESLLEHFRARRAEGYSLDDLKLATAGAHGDDYRRKHGYDRAVSVLRPTMIHDLIENGRRAAGRGPAAPCSEGCGRPAGPGRDGRCGWCAERRAA